MIKNYITIAWRCLVRNKISSIINISGLAIGLACVLLIGMYVKDELSYDRFFADSNRIYRVNTHEKMDNEEFVAGHTPPPVGLALVNNFPQIESCTRIFKPGNQVIHFTHNGQQSAVTEKSLLSVDSNFLQFFKYEMVAGDRATCLNGTNSLVLTERAAKKYFGSSPDSYRDAIGKTLIFDENQQPFIVTAVLKDLPTQSSLQFDVLQSNVGMKVVKRFNWSWIWLQMGTYIKLKPNVATDAATITAIEAKFPAMVKEQAATAFKRIGRSFDEFIKKGGKYELQLQPLTSIHLYSENIGNRYFAQGDIKYVYIFSAIALFIILLACVNFMNLATAQSGKRAKEVGIRKVLGSDKQQLIGQFMAEALIFTVLAAVVALFIVACSLPAFNQLAAKSLNFSAFFSISTVVSLVLLIVVTTLFAGSYPAFFLTAFKPAAVLKGSLKNAGGGFFTRNVLVVFQFSVSTVLIICTIVVFKQLMYNQSKDLGFNKENTIIIADADRLGKGAESFKQELMHLPEVANASISTGVPTQASYFDDSYVPEHTGDNVTASAKGINLSSFMVDENFVPTLKIQIATGRNFSKEFTDSASVILNETAANAIGWKNPIGKTMTYPGGNDVKYTVVGVVKDFNTESLHNPVTPFALFYTSLNPNHANTSFITVRIKPGDYAKIIEAIQNKWKQFRPDNPMEYSFMDAEYDALYKTDQTIGEVFTVFTFLSLTVACLGLLGLAIYTAERRMKEIGIRKVLGASVQNVVGMLSTDFVKLVIIASVIAFPIAWFAMNKWLQDFAYPTEVSWWIFALSTGMMVLIALVTISFQSIKAAMVNPVESLRSE